jgi:hypothetical protein
MQEKRPSNKSRNNANSQVAGTARDDVTREHKRCAAGE